MKTAGLATCSQRARLKVICDGHPALLRNILLDGLALEEERRTSLGVIDQPILTHQILVTLDQEFPRDLNLLKALVLRLIVCLKPIIQSLALFAGSCQGACGDGRSQHARSDI